MKYQVDDGMMLNFSSLIVRKGVEAQVCTVHRSSKLQRDDEGGRWDQIQNSLDPLVRAVGGRKKELDSLSKGGVVGVRGGSFGRPRLCSRSQIFFPKAVGTWGKGGPFDVTF